MQRTPDIKRVVTITKYGDKKTDSAYWRQQPYSARLAALEEVNYYRLEVDSFGSRMEFD